MAELHVVEKIENICEGYAKLQRNTTSSVELQTLMNQLIISIVGICQGAKEMNKEK